MRIGIIAEGGADIAVITNIIKGITGLDSNDIVPLLPKLKFDNTHLAHLDPESFSNWTLVKNECIEQKKIEAFLRFEDSTHIVIHIDTAESHLYGIKVPAKNYHQYCRDMRVAMINWINGLLQNNHSDKILYAIAIEEIDAWVLTIFDKIETCKVKNGKKRLEYFLGEKLAISNHTNFLKLTKALSQADKIKAGKFLEKNCSLKAFYEEVQAKLK